MGVNLRTVAASAGVSVATASRTFQRPSMVNADTRERVRAAARELGYSPRPGAGGRSSARKGVYGVIVPDLENPFFPAVLKGAQARAHQLGLRLLLADAEEAPDGELPLVQTLADQVDGIVLCSSRMDAASLREAAGLTPVSLVNRVWPGLPGVFADPTPGIPTAIRHLQGMGHRRLGYVGGPRASRSDAARRTAIAKACDEMGLEWVDVGHFSPSVEGGVLGAEAVLLADVTAVLVYNDFMALALIDRLRSFGVGVPHDLSVVGWDDIEFAALISPGLSTVRVPRYRMGAIAVELLERAHGALADEDPLSSRAAYDVRAGGALAPPTVAEADDGGLPQTVGVHTEFVPRGSTARVRER